MVKYFVKLTQTLLTLCLLFLPYAEVFGQQVNVPTTRQFTGQEHDETNLNYFKARYYNANTGKFTQQDPVLNHLNDSDYLKKATGGELNSILQNPQNHNSYNYTNNNPVRRIDTEGKWFEEFGKGE